MPLAASCCIVRCVSWSTSGSFERKVFHLVSCGPGPASLGYPCPHLLVGLVTFLFSHHASSLGAGGGCPVCAASLLRPTPRSDISSIVGKAIQHGICGITEIYISRDRQHPGRAGLFRAQHLPADICSIYWSEQRGYGGDGCSTKWCRCFGLHLHRHSG